MDRQPRRPRRRDGSPSADSCRLRIYAGLNSPRPSPGSQGVLVDEPFAGLTLAEVGTFSN